MWNRLSGRSRSFFVALAAIAVSFVLLRPACALWSSHDSGAGAAAAASSIGMPQDHGGSSVQCCASVSEPNIGAVLNAVAQALEDLPGGPVASALVVGHALPSAYAHRLWAPPPNPRSYYVRSARILR
jgi:hypothetical protein